MLRIIIAKKIKVLFLTSRFLNAIIVLFLFIKQYKLKFRKKKLIRSVTKKNNGLSIKKTFET